MQTFHVAPLPDNEERRLATLADYGLLERAGEEIFDSLTRLAAQICGTPIALIGLIARDRILFQSNIGMERLRETARGDTFCTHAIVSDELLEIADAFLDERFAGHPLVRGYPHARFYAGVPLIERRAYARLRDRGAAERCEIAVGSGRMVFMSDGSNSARRRTSNGCSYSG